MPARYYELRRRLGQRRSLGSDYAYQVHDEERLVASGATRGRMLRQPARFETEEGEFTISPTSKLANRWRATGSTGRPIADFNLSNLGGGKTTITDHDRQIEYRFSPLDGRISDTVKTILLIHTDRFRLTGPDDELLAVTGRLDGSRGPMATVRSLAHLAMKRSDWSTVEGLTLADTTWRPAIELVTAILVYKDQVVDAVRSP